MSTTSSPISTRRWRRPDPVARLVAIDIAGIEPEEGAPAPDRLVSGDPRFTTWNVEEAEGGLYAGVWQSTPGTWRIVYDEWEFCHILSGVSVIAEDGGEARTVRAGDSFVIRPGFWGTWEVVETTRKEYVIRV
jgi:uncharacterized cupin superfamily protein